LQDVPDGEATQSVPVGVGETLREAREHRGESLEVASGETRIHERFLRALEEDAPCESYPGTVYGRFFLREYSEYLGLNPNPLVEAFDKVTREPDVEPLKDRSLPKQRAGGSRVAAALAAVALVVVAALSLAGGRRDGPLAASPPPSLPAFHSNATPPPPSQTSTRPHPAPAAPGIRADVVVQDRSWIQAVVDGTRVPGRVFEAGNARTFNARHTLDLTLGNAGGVQLVVNGHRVPTGAAGQVVHLSFAFRGGRLLSG